eukprot:12012068-Alexandrium_andersonii.AAC.1
MRSLRRGWCSGGACFDSARGWGSDGACFECLLRGEIRTECRGISVAELCTVLVLAVLAPSAAGVTAALSGVRGGPADQ